MLMQNPLKGKSVFHGNKVGTLQLHHSCKPHIVGREEHMEFYGVGEKERRVELCGIGGRRTHRTLRCWGEAERMGPHIVREEKGSMGLYGFGEKKMHSLAGAGR